MATHQSYPDTSDNPEHPWLIRIFQAPLQLLIVVSVFVSVYAWFVKQVDISVPIVYFVVFVLYLVGLYLKRKKDSYP